MNLANMVIDSDDNVEIVEETKEDKYKNNEIDESMQNEIETEDADEDEDSENNPNAQNGNVNGENGQNTQNGENSQTGANGEDNVQNGNAGEGTNGGSGGIVEEEVEDLPELVAPVFKVESFDVDSISLNAQITIQDDEARLVREPSFQEVAIAEKGVGSYTTIADVNQTRADAMEKLYQYIVSNAKKDENIAYYKNNNGKITEPITLAEEVNPVVELDGSNYIVGPYKINKNNDIPFELETKFTDQNGTNLNGKYTLLNSNKEPAEESYPHQC